MKKKLLAIFATVGILSITTVALAYSNTKNPVSKPVTPATPETILKSVNQERTKAGLRPVMLDERLAQSAQTKADDMQNYKYFEHKNPKTGQNGYDLINVTGLQCKPGSPAENIADAGIDEYGILLNDAYHIMRGWMDSPGHKAAILNPDVDLLGFGLNKNFAVQHFCDLKE